MPTKKPPNVGSLNESDRLELKYNRAFLEDLLNLSVVKEFHDDTFIFMKKFRRLAVSTALVSMLAFSACSSAGSYDHDSSDPTLPTFAAQSYGAEGMQTEKNLSCRTNLIPARSNGKGEPEAAVLAAELRTGDPGDSDEIAFWIAPDYPNGENSLKPAAAMIVETQAGNTYEMADSKEDGFAAEYTIDGEAADASDSVTFISGSGKDTLYYPVPAGFITADDPVKSVQLEINGHQLAQCVPAEESSGIPESAKQPETSTAKPKPSNSEYGKYLAALDEKGIEYRSGESRTYKTDKDICEKMSDGSMSTWDLATLERLAYGGDDNNARRIETMVPILCPENQPLVDEAKSGNVVQEETFDGKFLVANLREENSAQVIQPGTWRTKESPVSDCYYERGDGAGNIIENNFVNFAQELTVTIAPSDGTFVSQRCGGWERVQ